MPEHRRRSGHWDHAYSQDYSSNRMSQRASAWTDCNRGTVYRCYADVSHRERAACITVWEKLRDVLGPGFSFRSDSPKGLWNMVFANGWTTARPLSEPPKLPPRDDEKLIVAVGRWREDLPPISPDVSHIPYRNKGDTAYIKYECHDAEHAISSSFTFCDRWGQPADEAYIAYFDRGYGGPPVPIKWMDKAVSKFDDHEAERLQYYNQDLAVHIVRRRLQQWADIGFQTRHGEHQVPGSEPNDWKLWEPVVPPSKVLKMMCDVLAELPRA